VDYILEKNMCEEKSLAAFLQLDEGLVRSALRQLQDHGILEQDEITRRQFEENYAEKLGVSVPKKEDIPGNLP